MYDLKEATALRAKNTEELEQEQLVHLQRHLRQALHIPFYRELYENQGVDVASIRTIHDISSLPFTTRDDLDRYPLKFGLEDQTQYRDIALTSGTTGAAVTVPYTAHDLHRLAFNEAVAFYGAGVGVDDRVLLTVTLDRCFIAGLAYYSGVTLLGAAAIRSGPGQPARQWHIIETLKPRIIVGVPTFLYELARWGTENGIDVAACPIDTIVTIGEPVRRPDYTTTSLGSKLEKLWEAKLFSSYGATEFETAFCDCRETAGGHVHPELMLAEVVDDKGQPLPDGEAGEVVVTPLGVEGFPLVRFRTGDVARLDSSPCACGWNTKRLGPIEGRLAQRLKYKGTTLYPETIFNALQDDVQLSAAYVEARLAADGSDDVVVVVGCDDPGVDVTGIEDRLQARLRVRPQVRMRRSADVQSVMSREGGRKARKFFDFRQQE